MREGSTLPEDAEHFDEAWFWSVVEAARAGAPKGRGSMVGRLRETLEPAEDRALGAFDRWFETMLARSNHWDLWRVHLISKGDCTETSFRRLRCRLVALGQEPFERVTRDWTSAFSLLKQHERGYGDDLRWVADDLHRERHAQRLPGPSEGIADDMQGEPWDGTVAELHQRFPELAEREGLEHDENAFKNRRAFARLGSPIGRALSFTIFGASALVLVLGVVGWGWWGILFGLLGVLAIWILAVAALIWDESRIETWVRRFLGNRRGVGTAAMLRGEVHVALVSAGPGAPVLDWHARHELDHALRYLRGEAERHGQALNFVEHEEVHEVHVDLPRMGSRRNLVWRDLHRLRDQALEQDSLRRFAGGKRGERFAVIFLAGVEDPWRSVALSSSRGAEPLPLEVVVCPPDIEAEDLTHEILHLFGAEDFYLEGDMRVDASDHLRERVVRYLADATSEAHMRASIMGSPFEPIEGEPRIVDAGTAYAVGWRDDVPRPWPVSE